MYDIIQIGFFYLSNSSLKMKRNHIKLDLALNVNLHRTQNERKIVNSLAQTENNIVILR